MRLYLGIDPGKDGAAVVLWEDLTVHSAVLARRDYTLLVGKGSRKDYDVKAMADFAGVLAYLGTATAFIERQGARPSPSGKSQGAVSNFSTGYGYGLWIGILAAKGVPVHIVTPQEWVSVVLKGATGEGKDRAVSVASLRVPDLNLRPGKATKPHSGLADAACLALYGIYQHGKGGVG